MAGVKKEHRLHFLLSLKYFGCRYPHINSVFVPGQLRKEASIDRTSVSPRSSVSPSSSFTMQHSGNDEVDADTAVARQLKDGSISPRLSTSGRLR